MADLGMLLSLYVAADQVPMIADVARALPRLQIVLNHLGFPRSGTSIGRDGLPHADVVVPPPTLPAVLELARYPNVSVMVSGEYAFGRQVYPFSDVSAVVRTSINTLARRGCCGPRTTRGPAVISGTSGSWNCPDITCRRLGRGTRVADGRHGCPTARAGLNGLGVRLV